MKLVTRLAHLVGLPGPASRKAKAVSPSAQAKSPEISQPDISCALKSGGAKHRTEPKERAMKMNPERKASAEEEAGYHKQNDRQVQKYERDNSNDPDTIKTHMPKQHTRWHNVAVSQEAADSPVLAVQLLNDTDLKSSEIRAHLRDEPESLSAFTRRFMKNNEPGWEFLDDEEQAFSAQQYALTKGDENGYLASKDVALRALKKMEEPMTEEEIAAVQEKARLTRNAENPDTPDNVAARQKADEAYQQKMAQAIVARNDSVRATGVFLPDDLRRADGRPVAPANEMSLILAKLKAGVPAETLMPGR